MIDEGCYVILGVASGRSRWFSSVGAWAAGGSAPIEFIRCVSVAEVVGRLRAGAPVSAVLADAATPGIDRELTALCARSGTALVRVADPRTPPASRATGDPVLPPNFGVDELLATLGPVAQRVRWRTVARAAELATVERDVAFRGQLIAVCGRGAAGSTVIAMALAQGLAASGGDVGDVALADLARNADLACYHDALDVVPALQELVEAHRHGSPGTSAVRSMLHHVDDRGYSLLLGLRRPHDWVALTPAAIESTLLSLCAAYRHVVADLTADFEGETQTGSVDVEERNALARLAAMTADVVVAVGRSGLKGTRDLVRLLDDLAELGVDPHRVHTVVTNAPRDRAARADATRALATLTRTSPASSPLFVPHRRGLDGVLRCADPLPSSLCDSVTRAVQAIEPMDQDTTVPLAVAS